MDKITISQLRSIVTWPLLLTLLALVAVSDGLEQLLYLFGAGVVVIYRFDLRAIESRLAGLKNVIEGIRDQVTRELGEFSGRLVHAEVRVEKLEEELRALQAASPHPFQEERTSPRAPIWPMVTACILLFGALNAGVFYVFNREITRVRGSLADVAQLQDEVKQKEARLAEVERELASVEQRKEGMHTGGVAETDVSEPREI